MSRQVIGTDFVLYTGEVLDMLAELRDESVDCVVTSPPYWGLRDYGTGEWEGGDGFCEHAPSNGAQGESGQRSTRSFTGATPQRDTCTRCGAVRVDRQLGLEASPDRYVERMVEVFAEIRRVLAPHGTVWLNIGSTYISEDGYPLAPTDAAWLAGLIDGEGCIQIHRQRRAAGTCDAFQLDLSVGMMTREAVERAHAITGLGSCHQQNRGVWDWSVRGRQTSELLRALYPFLVTKRRQAALGIMLLDDIAARRGHRVRPLSDDAIAYREALKRSVSACNQRDEPEVTPREPRPVALALKAKDDALIPARLALALQAAGWYLRADVIWSKPNPMPESVTDRPTKAHEYVFMLTKRGRYTFDQDAVAEPAVEGTDLGLLRSRKAVDGQGPTDRASIDKRLDAGIDSRNGNPSATRNVRTVWTIPTAPYAEAHFATYPPELVRRCLRAGCPRYVCRVCGRPRERIVERTPATPTITPTLAAGEVRPRRAGFYDADSRTIGWTDCGHNQWRRGVVLDPFIGSGTTALVARELELNCVGIELNPIYAALTAKRLQQLSLLSLLPPEPEAVA